VKRSTTSFHFEEVAMLERVSDANVRALEARLERETDYIQRVETRLRQREHVIREICLQTKGGGTLTKTAARLVVAWLRDCTDDPPELAFHK
jgi:hypothetical protein